MTKSELKPNNKKGKFHLIRVSPALYRALSELAAYEDIRLSHLVARLINAGLDVFEVRRPSERC